MREGRGGPPVLALYRVSPVAASSLGLGRLALFEEQLRRSQHEVATYGRRADEGILTADEVLRLQSDARVALARATAVAEFAGDEPERIRAELDALIASVRPILDSGQTLIAVHSA